MKLPVLISISAVLACTLLAGCSKSSDRGSSSSLNPSGGLVELKLKWNAGRRYDYELIYEELTKLNMLGQSETVDRNLSFSEQFSLFVLKARPEGGAEAELKFTAFKIESRLAGHTQLAFDSKEHEKDDGKNPVNAALQRLVGAHVRCLIGANGKVEKLEDYQQMMEQLLPTNTPPDIRAIVTRLSPLYSERSLIRLATQGADLPDKPVKAGDTWSVAGEDMERNCTFKGMNTRAGHECAYIEYSGNTHAPSSPDSLIKLNAGIASGRTWFDPSLGMTIENSVDRKLTMTVTAEGKPVTSPQEQKIALKLLGVAYIKG